MAYGHHTLGRAFSVTALDGIEVKVGDNFKPVEKVALPMRYRQADPTDVLQQVQYDFEMEITFLSWLDQKKKTEAQKEAVKKAALLAQQQQEAEAAAVRQAQQQAPVSSSQQQQPAVSMSNSVSPVISGVGQDILMPTPLHSGAPAATTSVPPKVKSQTSFDPRDFENNAFDPFESAELQTLNDMDELRAVLGNSMGPQQQHQQQQQQGSSSAEMTDRQQQAPAQNNTSEQHNNTISSSNVVMNDASPSEAEYQNIQKQPEYQNVQRQPDSNQSTEPAPAAKETDTSRHDYQNVQIEPGSGRVMFKPETPGSPLLPPRNIDQTLNGALDPSLMPNGVEDAPEGTVDKSSTLNLKFPTRTPLPPVTPSSSRENSNVSTASGSTGASSSSVNVVSSAGGSSGPKSSSSSPPTLPERNGPGSEQQSQSPRSRSRSPPPSYFAVDYGSRNPAVPMPGAVPLPGYTPEPPPSYPQSLSRYSPLPNSSSPSPRQLTLSEEERRRPDPIYDAMSTEDRNFVMTIMGMGFPKSRTAKVVKEFGRDDRKVVESLCAVESLCSEGFPEDRVVEAVYLHSNDQEKAKDFLKLWKQFEELGFKGDDIKRELIVHNNNQEKVLDSLTA